MQKETKKISSELAIGIIIIFAIIVGTAIYRAGSFSEALNYLPQINKKKNVAPAQPEFILFASNGSREIYKVQKDDGKWAVVIDGQESAAYDNVFNPTFSEDGTQFAYGATNEEKSFVVLNNQASDKKYDSIGQIIFDQNGKLIYKVIGADGEFLVIDGQEGQKYTSIGQIVIMDDGRVAFQAELDGKEVTVIDGQVVDNSGQNSGNGPGSTGTTGSGSNTGNNNSGSGSTKPPTSPSSRSRKDWNVPNNDKSYPICTGTGCNF